MKTIEEMLEVYLGPTGEVCIAQRDMAEDCFIAIAPEEVDTLIDWLRQKKEEALVVRNMPGKKVREYSRGP